MGDDWELGVTVELSNFQDEMAHKEAHCIQTVTKYSQNHGLYHRLMIFNNVTACTSQPVAFNGHLNTHEHLTGLRNKPQQKQTINFWQWCSSS